LKSEYWEDKAGKILEIWHFEDWLPRWKAWKRADVNNKYDNKYRRLYNEVYEG